MSQERQPGKGASPDQKKPAAAPAKGTAAPRTATGSIPAQGVLQDRPSAYSTDSSMLTKHQKSALGSQFADTSAERRRNSLLATSVPSGAAVAAALAQEESTSVGLKFDGKDVPAALQGRDVWIAVQAPLQSREGRRTRAIYEMVIKQFGVTVNPRYADEAPGKIRGHIFAWDVSRAMNCEIPHFVGAKELSLAQTCDWVRHEGPMRGWKRVAATDEVIELANSGKMVVALPRETRTKHIALIGPQDMPTDGSPRLTGICLKRDVNLHPREMFGAKAIDVFWHE